MVEIVFRPKKRIFIISLLAFTCLVLVTVIILAKYSNVLIKGEIEKALGGAGLDAFERALAQ